MSENILFSQIDQTLDDLINNAKDMVNISMHRFSQMDILSMQKKQESLLSHLVHLDQLLQNDLKNNTDNNHVVFSKKMKLFKQLNQQFIANLSHNSDKIVHFNKKTFKKKRPRIRRKKTSRF